MLRRLIGCTLLLLLLLTLFGTMVSAESANLLVNGGFEEGFDDGVGVGWTSFNNGGDIAYGFRSDDWHRVVLEGQYSQLINLHTQSVGGSEKDRYAGLFQTVDVVPGSRYMFTMYGLVRSTEGSEAQSSYNYRVELGYDMDGGTDPWSVTDWVEMDKWHEYYMDKPGNFDSFARGVTATTDKLTVFVRVWKKFPTAGESAVVNLDGLSLYGPRPTGASASGETLPQTGGGGILPLVGLALGVVAAGLTGTRVLRQRQRS